MKFIKVLALTNSHIVTVKNIIYITPYGGVGNQNKSTIKIKDSDIDLYSIETPEEIYIKLEAVERNKIKS